jgi:multicomponent K+:H+ antiporter subunit G
MIGEISVSVLIIVGAAFALAGSIGLARFPDFYTRLHGPTKATTVGVGAILIASMIRFNIIDGTLSFHEVLITLFLFMTAPVSAHLLARGGLHRKVHSVTRGPKDDHGHGELGTES